MPGGVEKFQSLTLCIPGSAPARAEPMIFAITTLSAVSHYLTCKLLASVLPWNCVRKRIVGSSARSLCDLPRNNKSFQRQKNQHIRKKAKWNKEQLSGSTPLRDLVLSHAKTEKMFSCISPPSSLTDTAACKTARRLNSL